MLTVNYTLAEAASASLKLMNESLVLLNLGLLCSLFDCGPDFRIALTVIGNVLISVSNFIWRSFQRTVFQRKMYSHKPHSNRMQPVMTSKISMSNLQINCRNNAFEMLIYPQINVVFTHDCILCDGKGSTAPHRCQEFNLKQEKIHTFS